MKIIIDEREVALYERMVSLNTDILLVKQVLQIGDAIIQNDDVDLCVIERKTLQDLLSSIKDGRYEEQSHRLIHTSGLSPHNIIYIIEGNMSTLQTDKEKQLIYSSITSLNYYKGFSVLRTTSVNDTADLILGMTRKIEKNNAKGVLPYTNCEQITPYANVVKKTKKDNITTENISQIMLCQIPGVSTVTSTAIFTKFGTIKKLITSIAENPDCMNDLSYIQSGKSRKVNSTAIKKIKDFLME
jgi:ERCC4-type nuclease